MTDVNKIIDSMDEKLFLKLRTAIELGKWENGQALTEDQKESTMQLVILYQAKKMKNTDHLSVGNDGDLIHKSKAQLKREMQGDTIEIKNQ
ncbi:DUF1315 family protein [Paraferrimonas sp. SM1919]|uniref:DUF1315 family protein n=1 Tax=Paraferrimonas sp. SM1919 TaxID=2662263 RepID=UPI0013D1216D|nr:DUF1315 family protein [Paraferrimonas sp. SM1919]